MLFGGTGPTLILEESIQRVNVHCRPLFSTRGYRALARYHTSRSRTDKNINAALEGVVGLDQTHSGSSIGYQSAGDGSRVGLAFSSAPSVPVWGGRLLREGP
jgi:hypothetical protein